MLMMNRDSLPVRLYSLALLIYPRRLRQEHCGQMLQTLRDARADHRAGSLRFWSRVYFDLLESSLLERTYMLRESVFRRPVMFHALVLAVIFSGLGLSAAMVMQQMLRRGADQPQIDMAKWYAAEIASGEKPGDVIPPGYVDLERSLEPFIIFYDDSGRAGAGTGYFDQELPTPPKGVFEYVRQHGSEHVTWEPRPGTRFASIVQRVNGKNPGFVLSGRSLRMVEQQESLLRRMSLGLWFAMLALLFGGAAFLNRAQRMQERPAS
jgi:hypothetical protein